MGVRYQKFITRADLKANPDTLYVFGDNLMEKGLGGQAKEMRGEPNAVGIPTKRSPSMDDVSFFNDRMFSLVRRIIDQKINRLLEHLKLGGEVVIPEDGIGTGLADLRKRAPLIHDYIQAELKHLDHFKMEYP